MANVLQAYYQLTKPGIIYGNALNTIAGFLLASTVTKNFNLRLFAATIIGTCLVIASACVFNNYIDRNIDKKMSRTQKRGLATGDISGRSALLYATILGVMGFAILAAYTNTSVIVLGVVAIIMYVIVYGIAKRRSVHGTIIGSIAGSLPPVAGYVAVTNSFDSGAVILFLILTFWQMPHFFAIAMYRHKDYAAASLPVWPVKKGMHSTKLQIIYYIIGFILANLLLSYYRYTGYIYAITMTVIGLIWLWRGIKGFKIADDIGWARKMFFFSLIVILVQCLMLSIGGLLP